MVTSLMNIGVRRATLVVILVALSATCRAQIAGNGVERCFLTGSVVDAITGEPVRAAEVSVTRLSGGADVDEPANSVTTDSNGRFAIANLAPGRYVLQASQENYTDLGRPSGSGYAIITLVSDQRAENVVLVLMPGGTISGQITDQTGAPIPGASLAALEYSYRTGKRDLEEMASSSTNLRGEYRIAGLVPGRYLLRATTNHPFPDTPAQASSKQSDALVPLYYPGATDFTQASELAVRAGQELSGIDVRLAPVRVFHIQGTVIDSRTSAPVKGAGITLLSDNGNTFFPATPTSTDAQGGFNLAGIPPGSYLLVAQIATTNPEPTLWGRKSVAVADASVQDLNVLVGTGATVSGRVRMGDKASPSVSSLTAVLEPQEGITLNSMMPGVESASVNPDGTFLFHHVPEGAYRISFFPLPAGFYLGEQAGTGILEAGIKVGSDHASRQLDLILSASSASIDGMVLGEGGEVDRPVAGVTVVLVPDLSFRGQPHSYRTSVTNRLGRFTLRGIAPGDYKLFAWQEVQPGAFLDPDFLGAYEERGQSVHLKETERASVQLRMIPAEGGQ